MVQRSFREALLWGNVDTKYVRIDVLRLFYIPAAATAYSFSYITKSMFK